MLPVSGRQKILVQALLFEQHIVCCLKLQTLCAHLQRAGAHLMYAYVYIHVHTYAYIYIYTHTYEYVYIYIYTHT